ncbi:Hypothetical protein A7982_08262 [Minicystis rosea]|nr:Hypothetical protein A7982_08262 [Minicystis rosea]
MRLSTLLSSFTLGAVIALSASTAEAQRRGRPQHDDDGADYPMPYAQRPLTLPRMVVAPELDFMATRYALGTYSTVPTGINIGASFGITRDLEVGALFLPVQFAPRVAYGLAAGAQGNLQFFGTYRFVRHRDIEVGVRIRTSIITEPGAGAIIEGSIPLLFHFGRGVRLDAELGVPITVAASNLATPNAPTQTYVGINLPLALSFNVIAPLYLGVKTGIVIDDLTRPKEFASIPLGIYMGYSIGRDKPILDLVPFFTWSRFLTPGGGLGNERVNAGLFTTGITARGYIYL